MIPASNEAAHHEEAVDHIFALNFGKHFIGCDDYFYDLDVNLMVMLGGKIVDDKQVSHSTTILKDSTQEFYFKTCNWGDQILSEHRPILIKDIRERLEAFVWRFPKVFKIQQERQPHPKTTSMYLHFLKRSL